MSISTAVYIFAGVLVTLFPINSRSRVSKASNVARPSPFISGLDNFVYRSQFCYLQILGLLAQCPLFQSIKTQRPERYCVSCRYKRCLSLRSDFTLHYTKEPIDYPYRPSVSSRQSLEFKIQNLTERPQKLFFEDTLFTPKLGSPIS